MSNVVLTKEEREGYTLIKIDLMNNVTPEDLKLITPLTVDYRKGVVLSGRGPIWLYGYLIHNYHPAAWVAVYDPRIGAVVVQSHTRNIAVGDVIDVGVLV
jgi:CRISPR-associated protein Csx3